MPPPASNFLRAIIAEDNRTGKYGGKVVTRFPPEPNGYLHYGHAKSIILNFGLAAENGGRCNLRFDDTNPANEDVEFESSIADAVRWLGFDWGTHRYHASDYYDQLYAFAEWFIEHDLAYVESSTPAEMRALRGTLTEAGKPSAYRSRSVAENLDLFRRMKAGEFPDGAHVLRLKIDLASPNINMRDPAIYRIRHASHHRTGDKWCIYPLYDYTHCISDALERITHSICTLEFQDHRPLYDWVLARLAEGGKLARPLPQQHEFAAAQPHACAAVEAQADRARRATRCRRLGRSADADARRRAAARLHARRLPALRRAHRRVEIRLVDRHERARGLHARGPQRARARRMAVLDPVRLVIDNYPPDRRRTASRRTIRSGRSCGKRALPFSRELWIERDDYQEDAPKGYFRLAPGAEVRLRFAYIVRCVGAEKDAAGNVVAVHCTYDPATRSGTPGADARKVKGNIHWLSAAHALPAEVRLYDRLFAVPFPARADRPAQRPTAAWRRGRRARDRGRRRRRGRRRPSPSSATGSTISIRTASA